MSSHSQHHMMICACAGSETGPRCVCVCVCVGQWGEADQGVCVTVAWWTIAREQYVGQGLALANLSWPEPWLGVLNFCMHDQWHWIKKRGERQRHGGGEGMSCETCGRKKGQGEVEQKRRNNRTVITPIIRPSIKSRLMHERNVNAKWTMKEIVVLQKLWLTCFIGLKSSPFGITHRSSLCGKEV